MSILEQTLSETVYETVTPPAATPNTSPKLSIVARESLLMPHVPPETESYNDSPPPMQQIGSPTSTPAENAVVTFTVSKATSIHAESTLA